MFDDKAMRQLMSEDKRFSAQMSAVRHCTSLDKTTRPAAIQRTIKRHDRRYRRAQQAAWSRRDQAAARKGGLD